MIIWLLAPLLLTQLFSSEEKRVLEQHRVTVYGAPGAEPFTVFCVPEQTTAKQLLDVVSTFEIERFLKNFIDFSFVITI